MGKSKELAELGQVVSQSGGNVGIGADSPTEALHIAKAFPAVKLDNIDAGGHSWRIASGSTNSGFAGKLQIYNEDTSTIAAYIDASGRVTMPYQPAFHAYADIYGTSQTGNVLFKSSAQNFTLENNAGGHFNTSTGRFTAPVNGRYMFTGSYSRSQDNGGVWMQVNSNALGMWNLSYGADWQTACMSRVVYMNANDYFEFYYGSVGPSFTCQGYKVMLSGYLLG